MAIYIIINPQAGSAGDIAAIRKSLERLGELTIEETCSPEHAEECGMRAAREGFGRIVAAGGDGTINRVVNGVMRSAKGGRADVELGVLPLGTGNDFSYSIGMNLPLNDALDALAAWEARAIDVVHLEARDGDGRPVSRYFVNASAGGFIKEVGESTDSDLKRSILGSLSYALTAAASLSEIDHYELSVTVDGEADEHRATASIVSNGRTIGGGIEIAPEAVLDDGVIESLIVPEGELSELLMAGMETVGGSAGLSGVTRTRRGREIRIASTPPLPLSADGEEVGFTPAVYRVLPRALRVIFGPGA